MNELQDEIYNILDAYGGSATRPTICLELYDSETTKRTTVYDALRKMEKAGIVKHKSVKSGYRGRPKTVWYIAEGM